jgi:ADP-dependent NAD(P)H-hydrate dehydratase / NAD(P)H-hydrate epimerase
MKILTAKQLREADAFTIANDSIDSIDLMERAAKECVSNLMLMDERVIIFCGPGNNGGDGLAIARLLLPEEDVSVFLIGDAGKRTDDFLTNLQRLSKLKFKNINEIKSKEDFPELSENDKVIDAIFGTGLSKPAEGIIAELIHHINSSHAYVISIDMPSGLFSDTHTPPEAAVIHPNRTLTFQSPKLAFFFAENVERVRQWDVLDINLNQKFIDELTPAKNVINQRQLRAFLKQRKKFSHKGDYGHALLITGGYGKMGAAVLMTKACMQMGTGLTTVHVPKHGLPIIQTAAPEAMAQIDFNEKYFSDNIEPDTFSAVGVGPGIGTEEITQTALKHLLLYEKKVPLVLDADALNIISLNKDWLKLIPHDSILTPHHKEFERLTYKAENDFARHEMQVEFSKFHRVFVILKGANTCITTPDGEAYFNLNGNPGLAKGGSGDVLTGMLAGLLAQGYTPAVASQIGVYMHGLAGDIAARNKGMESMIASDIINAIPEAFREMQTL